MKVVKSHQTKRHCEKYTLLCIYQLCLFAFSTFELKTQDDLLENLAPIYNRYSKK